MDPDEAEDVWSHREACEVCGSTRRLAVDHDHETGRVRGILCGKCNQGVGMFDDDPDLLERTARYLRGEQA